MTASLCEWCDQPLPGGMRRDARFCTQRCRQASHRFTRGAVARARASVPMRFAYADPPYPGNAFLYRDHQDYGGEVDHAELVDRLQAEYPDGWALSTSAAALPYVLSLCPADVSVAAWFRRPRPHKTARGPISSWEPVVYAGGRQIPAVEPSPPGRHDGSPRQPSVRDPHDGSPPSYRYDALVYPARPRTTDVGRVIGAKPADFAYWMFDLLGARPGDTLDDLYPGSGGIGRAWQYYTSLDDVDEAAQA